VARGRARTATRSASIGRRGTRTRTWACTSRRFSGGREGSSWRLSWPTRTRASCSGEGELLWLLADERAEGVGEPDELQRRAEETIWEADREDRERAERFIRGLHAAEPAAPPQA